MDKCGGLESITSRQLLFASADGDDNGLEDVTCYCGSGVPNTGGSIETLELAESGQITGVVSVGHVASSCHIVATEGPCFLCHTTLQGGELVEVSTDAGKCHYACHSGSCHQLHTGSLISLG